MPILNNFDANMMLIIVEKIKIKNVINISGKETGAIFSLNSIIVGVVKGI